MLGARYVGKKPAVIAAAYLCVFPTSHFFSLASTESLMLLGMCGATLPDELERELNERADDGEAVAELGVAYATLQCSDLLARGAPGIHFYTLNRSPATRAILAALRAAHPWTRARAAV